MLSTGVLWITQNQVAPDLGFWVTSGGNVSNVTLDGSTRGSWAEVLRDPGRTEHERVMPGASVIPTGPAIHYAELPLTSIQPNPRQPRTVFDEEALDELAASLREIGLLQPVVVRPVAHEPVDSAAGSTAADQYEIVAGERRFRCAQRLGWVTIPAMVRPTQDADLLRDALLENVHRAALNPLEEAAAYQQLLADFGCTQDELSARLGRSRPQIANTIRLLRLPPAVQRRVAAGVLSQGHARALLSLPDDAAMVALATRIVAEGMSVRTVEEIVSVGEQPTRGRGGRRRQASSDDGLQELADGLADRLDTRVHVTMGKAKGRVTIEFAGREDLDRILDVIADTGTPT
jgi:ParB family transcriptional regulator, chromosome partitioning protein